ncbi:hypothetical protein PHMEG_0008847 [Phytophthora megakarya]|uniref:A20-type domain-containing protein n=1 Tax=Phytophthora megakarya TaxID=4795 RepID=A0A225WHL0_9STRA|nr:hypothetical protein PHMEG_0008847 [Phytophthora megakarya]
MSVHVKAQCRAGCGDVGDPELDYFCVDCHGDQIELRQQEELRNFMPKESGPPRPEQEISTLFVKKYRGPRPVDHAKALDEFLHQYREQNADAVARELTFLKREIAISETSRKQLRKYMVATDEEEQVDSKEWCRYEFGRPKQVPTRDVEEAVELAAQLKLFCRWRRRVVQKRIDARREQLEAERLALRKQKKKSVSVPSFGKLIGSTKTAVEQFSPVAKQKTPAANKRRPILNAWQKKSDK